jgi:ArsR family transcriptional regulator, arsenate/arsenite/antimonite-responsive transcriptional repressor
MVGTSRAEVTTVADRTPLDVRLELLKAVADPTRLAVLDSLAADGARCHRDLEVELGVPANRLSFHLKVLRDAGLVRANRRGRRVRYCLEFGAIDAVRAALPALTSVDNLDPACTACERDDAAGER